MASALTEILKQAEQLSVEEQLELAARLKEQAQRHAEATPHNGCQGEASGAEPPAQPGAEESVSENDEEEDWLDVFRLNHVPPKRTYMARARFHYVGRGKPMPYELDDDLRDDEERSEEESS